MSEHPQVTARLILW